MASMSSNAAKKDIDVLYIKGIQMKDDDSQLVAIVYRLLDLMAEASMSYVVHVRPPHMGIHPSNRGGKEMLGADMHKKGSKIVNVGFTFKLCSTDRAIAFENSPDTNHCETYTIKSTKGNSMFYQYTPNTVRGGSVGCGHLNQFLAAVRCEATTNEPSLQVPGKTIMDKHRITSGNRDLANAVEHGL